MATIPPNVATSAEEAAKIKPRAEFRVFGHGIIEIVKARMWNGKTVLQQVRTMPAETYFVSRRTQGVNVKVRDGLLDIKVKTGETEEGYEIFQPRGKFKFPVNQKDLATILAELKASLPPELSRMETCTIEAFLAGRAHASGPRARHGGKDALGFHHRRHHLRVRAGVHERRPP